MSLAKVVTAQKLCDQYNAGLEEAREEAQKHNTAAIQDLVEVKAPLSTINRCMLQLPEPCPPIDARWCARFLHMFNWKKRSLNTQGNFLEWNDPRLQASRERLREHIAGGVHRYLVLNLDQLWRQSLRFGKSVLMKKSSSHLASIIKMNGGFFDDLWLCRSHVICTFVRHFV